jgi:pyruvyltransferase
MTGEEPTYVRFPKWYNKIPLIKELNKKEVILVAGSILGRGGDYNSTIWGSGFISINSKLKSVPKKICAVRGPLTREIILSQNIDCPKIYGDPALLLPKYYNPKIEKKYALGIIPHYYHYDNHKDYIQSISNQDTLVIDIREGIFPVIDKILSCNKIASSSLHGIIVSDAYDIPSIRLEFPTKLSGGNFKFYDYLLSVNRSDLNPFIITKETTAKDIIKSIEKIKIQIDLNKLLSACPFIK